MKARPKSSPSMQLAFGAAVLYGAGMTCAALHFSSELQSARLALALSTEASKAERPHTIATQWYRTARYDKGQARERTDAGGTHD